MKLVAFLTAERLEQLHLGGAGNREGLDQCALTSGSQRDDHPAAIVGIAPAQYQALMLEAIENGDQVRGMDAKGSTESELSVWASFPQAVQHAELLGRQTEVRKGVPKPRSRDLREL